MHKTPEITRLIHENFWTILAFAFGRPIVAKVIADRFKGEWKYLNKTVYERAEVLADRALLEMATQMRILDDAEKLSDRYKVLGSPALGEVLQADGNKTPLYFRDMTNKVIHAAVFQWELSNSHDPKVICLPHDGERWKSARLDIVPLMSVIGSLIH
ncbi:MAG TPA: hypothetical protein VG821_04870 [Rhizomicrobium sp.]|jgi:hypothetical protein|nr:hypothetical protein [Rhizomicrobium sp.]